jgi:hypothetical protein
MPNHPLQRPRPFSPSGGSDWRGSCAEAFGGP